MRAELPERCRSRGPPGRRWRWMTSGVSRPQRILPSGHANEGTRRGGGGVGIWLVWERPRPGGGAGLGHPDCDLGLKDFQDRLGSGEGRRLGIFPGTRAPATPGIPRARSPQQDERAHVRYSSSPTLASSVLWASGGREAGGGCCAQLFPALPGPAPPRPGGCCLPDIASCGDHGLFLPASLSQGLLALS